jgi:Fic family protein
MMQNENCTSESLENIDLKADRVRKNMKAASQDQVTDLWFQLDISTIYHDLALEGQVVDADELEAAFDSRAITDATSLPLYLSLRSHRRALDFAREVAPRKKLDFSMDLFKDFHVLLASDLESAKSGRYRKEIPLHRTYFHQICQPNKISANMRKLTDWLNDPEDALSMHPIQWIAKFHYQFMRIFPFIETTGKIGRIMANMVLIRQGYLPAIIHATERQRYYEAIRSSQEDLTQLFAESAISSLEAAERFLERSAVAC